MSARHYNAGHVWGHVVNVLDKESDAGTPYLALEIECPNDIFGNIKTYGRIWGKQKIDNFLKLYAQQATAIYHLIGFFSQYEKGGKRRSNYTVFKFFLSSQSEMRATFVLKGEVTAVSKKNDDGLVSLYVRREGAEGYDDQDEDFEVFTMNAQEVDGLDAGDLIKTKGVLRYREAEDFYGDRPEDQEVKPYVMEEIEVLKRKEAF